MRPLSLFKFMRRPAYGAMVPVLGLVFGWASLSTPWAPVVAPWTPTGPSISAAPLGEVQAPDSPPTGVRPASLRTRHIVVLIMDGARYDHTFGDPAYRYIPRMGRDLAPQGAVLTQFYNDGHTVTTSGHATLKTGKRQQVLGEAAGRFEGPTFLEHARAQLDLDREAVWFITGKTKLGAVFERSIALPQSRPSVWAYDVEDEAVAQQLWGALGKHRPRFTVVNFPSVDRRAHDGDWQGYLAAISRFDGVATETWRRIQADPLLRDTTTLVITNDHGRRYDDWTSHGDDSEGSRRIMGLVLGPDTRPGSVVATERNLADLGVTMAGLLGVAMPGAEGRIMHELFSLPESSFIPAVALPGSGHHPIG